MSSGRFSILLTRPIATALIAAALIVLVLPLLLPSVKRLLRTVPPDDTT
jgi:TctA family transporter